MRTLPSISGAWSTGAALPEEVGLFVLAFDEDVEFAADPLGAVAGADLLLEAHELAAAGFDGALGDLGVEVEGLGAFFVGVAEDAEPVDLGGLDEGAELFEVGVGFAGEADDEAGAEDEAGDDLTGLIDDLEETVAGASALHAPEDVRGGVLEGDVEVLGDVSWRAMDSSRRVVILLG